MGISLFYRACLLTNVIISLLFLLLGLVALFTAPSVTPESILALFFIFGSFGLLLLFDFICYRLLKANKEKQQAPDWLRKYGRPLFVICCILVVAIIFFTFTALISSLQYSRRTQIQAVTFFMILYFALFLLSAITFIFNGIIFYRALRQNKTVVNTVIEAIGESISVE